MELTFTNAKGRDAQVAAESVRITVRLRRLDRDGRQCRSARILKGTLAQSLSALRQKFPDVGQALVAGDPEIDLESTGQIIRPGDSKRVYVNPASHVVHHVTCMEIVHNPDGTEKGRRPAQDAACNLGVPIVWSGKLIPRAEAARKFVFAGARQIRHVNGLTYDFLYEIARELEAKDSLLLVGTGPKGTGPLVLRCGALAYRGFLEGRTRGAEYLLILHLSNLELKTAVISSQPSAVSKGIAA